MRPDKVVLIIAMAGTVYLIRSALMVGMEYVNIPRRLERAMKYIPIGVLSGLVIPQILVAQGAVDLSFDNPFFVGALVAGAVGVKWRNPLWAMATGMAVVASIRMLTG